MWRQCAFAVHKGLAYTFDHGRGERAEFVDGAAMQGLAINKPKLRGSDRVLVA
jgi:hypothetical protein